MTDIFGKDKRSEIMSRVKGSDTKPELVVRRRLFAAGFRYRLHAKDLPGKPDIVLPRFRMAVFVHGCFWHGHSCRKGRRPSSNDAFWAGKLDSNMRRDAEARAALAGMGWSVWTVWECQLKRSVELLVQRLSLIKERQPRGRAPRSTDDTR